MAQLEQNLQGMQQPAPEAMAADAPYLTMDNFKRDFGSWYGNDDAIGELLFNQFREYGVDTKPAVEATLRSVLEETIKQCNTLLSRFQQFQTMQQQLAQQQAMQGIQLQAQMQQTLNETQNVANAINSTLAMQGVDPYSQSADMTQPDGMPAEQQLPPTEGATTDTSAAAEPPAPAEPPAEGAPTNAEPPADTGAGGAEPPADTGTGTEPPAEPPATTSDARVKNIKGPSRFLNKVLSDRRMKNVKPASTISPGILAACKTGF